MRTQEPAESETFAPVRTIGDSEDACEVDRIGWPSPCLDGNVVFGTSIDGERNVGRFPRDER